MESTSFLRLGWVLSALALWSLGGCSKSDSPVQPKNREPVLASVQSPLEAGDWPLQAVVATNSVQLEDRFHVTGDIAVTQASTGPTLGSGVEF